MCSVTVGWLTPELLGDEQAANAVVDKVAVDLLAEMRASGFLSQSRTWRRRSLAKARSAAEISISGIG